jgi:hypothetical protein
MIQTLISAKLKMANMKRIKADLLEFAQAQANGSVYGKWNQLYVYAELGQEVSYTPRPNDDPNTEYKMFRNCELSYTDTEEKLDNALFGATTTEELLIIYC